MDEDHRSHDAPADSPEHSWKRWAPIIAAAAVIAGLGFYMVWAPRDTQTQGDETYQWVLQFPGTPPGATFKTRRGDDPAEILSTVLPEDSSAWKSLLAAGDAVTLRLSCSVKRRIPLLTQITWWRMDRKWRPSVADAGFGFPAVGIRQVLPSSYEVFRTRNGVTEVAAGPMDRYENAESAMLAEVARIIEGFQNGEKIEGVAEMFLQDP
jgi:hypothetical protein